MAAALEIAIGVGRLVEREYPVNDGLQAMQRDGPVHRLKIGPAAGADRTERHATPPSSSGSSIMPERDRLDPIRLICPPTASALIEFVSVPGPPMSTTQSAPLPSVRSTTFSCQSGVRDR